jgi:hypothetical protein
MNLYSDGEFVRKRSQHIVQEICPEKDIVFNIVNLSRATMTSRGEDISSESSQKRNKGIRNLFFRTG